MAKYLVIVESPAKVKTIKKFLGANYEVAASNGHVRDFPKSQFGIDVEHDYEPKYITIRGKGDILANLRKEVKKAEKIYLATDPDREGEAISWHLMEALKLSGKKVYRITFNEITKTAVKESLKHAREIDMNLVDAQQARRMLDRMVGYRISPLLWAKVKRGLCSIPDSRGKKTPDSQILRGAGYQAYFKNRSGSRSSQKGLRKGRVSGERRQKGRAHQEGSASLYHLYPAAGSQ